MKSKFLQKLIIIFSIFSVSAFLGGFPARRVQDSNVLMKLKLVDLSSMVLVAAEPKLNEYNYGDVTAPGWVLPLGALLVIGTAALPILLRPGEAALEQQRENEEKTNSQFNKKKEKD